MPAAEIRVEGLASLRRSLSRLDSLDASKELSAGLKAAAQVVAEDAKRRVPVRSGKARGSVRAVSGGNRAFVVGGKAKVPYYAWLDFGSRNPRDDNPPGVGPWTRSGKGPSKGRFIYPALDAREREVVRLVGVAVGRAIDKSGF